ncbi:hypothetical protein F485_gp148 [Aeromonas phage CC2]|uniref:Uncharacterized protein n=1 Tax=Aeromonas phage CC2 TaxID=1204516 RepID=I6X731_9CAUD|nr:hypothetical protein F485_gp148 [Aeromonas phage CC2]AFN39237.1 hypothetical protein CC2_150 [Aeromonas phage CC2]
MIYHDTEKCCMNENGMIIAKIMEERIVAALSIFDNLQKNEIEEPIQAAFYDLTHSGYIQEIYHSEFCKLQNVEIPLTQSIRHEIHSIFTSCLNYQIVTYKMRRSFKGE